MTFVTKASLVHNSYDKEPVCEMVPVEECEDLYKEVPFLVDDEECEDIPKLQCTEVRDI